MNIETRRTAAGTEYWDTVNKKIRFVPSGKEPDFEVAKNPITYVTNAKQAKERDQAVTTETKSFDELNGNELLSFASKHNIDVPGTMKKAETIRAHILSELDQRKNEDIGKDNLEDEPSISE